MLQIFIYSELDRELEMAFAMPSFVLRYNINLKTVIALSDERFLPCHTAGSTATNKWPTSVQDYPLQRNVVKMRMKKYINMETYFFFKSIKMKNYIPSLFFLSISLSWNQLIKKWHSSSLALFFHICLNVILSSRPKWKDAALLRI